MGRRLAPVMAGTAAAIAVAVACEKSPTRPGLSVGNSIRQLEILGPSTVAPGGTARFRAVALGDGSTRDVTSNAAWVSSDRRLVTIVAGGVATGVARGEAMITASVEGSQGIKPVIVLPDGTYRLIGVVRESDTMSPILGARVEARAGGQTVIATQTDSTGKFTLYGVPSGAELRVTRDGYLTHAETVTLTDHGSINLTLALSAARPDLSGLYTLTVGPATCSNPTSVLDAALRRRTYQATVTQNGAQLRVTLSGAEFRQIRGVAANAFNGTFEPSSASFRLTPPDYYYLYANNSARPDVVEEFADTVGLLIAGTATTTLSSTGMTGTLNGLIESYRGLIATTAPTARCVSSSIPFALTRR